MDYTLSIKTHRPAPPTARVIRPSLIQRLNESLARGCPMTLVSAPAGFGKTTCLAEWLADIQYPVAWITLDENDQDPGRFFTILASALQAVANRENASSYSNLGQIGRVLRAGQVPPPQAIASAWIADVLTHPTPMLLVLDDFHVVHDRFILEVFEILLSNLFQTPAPQPFHLVLSSREDPPIPLARLRANNRLTEIRAEDLRFSQDEAGRLLNEILGLSLNDDDIRILKERTEGWPAGLQLAGLSIRGCADPSAFVRGLSGNQRFILNYLTEEVLNRQSGEMQEFLLHTSILNRFCADLCNAVTGRIDSQKMLEQMLVSNLFLVPMDESQRWYRFHHLFADLLRNRASLLLPDKAAPYHLKAAQWFEQAAQAAQNAGDRADLITAGIRHALAIEDYNLVVRFIETYALELLNQWYAKTIEAWLASLPPEWRMKSPLSALSFARMHLMRGDFVQATPYLERLKAIFSIPPAERPESISPALEAEWLALQASLLLGQRQPQASLELAEKALQIAPPDHPRVLCQVYLSIANTYREMNDTQHAEEAFLRLIQIGRAAADTITEIWGLSALSLMMIEQGYLRRGYDLAVQGAEKMERSGMMSPICAGIYGEIGQVAFHWHHLDQTETYLRKSAELSALVGFSDSEIYYAVSRSRLALLRGDIDTAATEIEQAAAQMRVDSPAIIREEVISQRITVHLAQGNFSDAEEIYLKEISLLQGSYAYPQFSPGQDIPYQQGLLFLTGLRLFLYQARHPGTASTFPRPDLAAAWKQQANNLLAVFNKRHYVPLILQILILQAQFHAAIHRPDSALSDLTAALDLAELEGYLSDFVMEGKPMADLLSLAFQSSQPGSSRANFIQKILGLFRLSSEALPSTESPSTTEALTERELAVLRLIAEGKTYAEIAAQLVVSINTVRTHIKSIYRKFNANNRIEAIQAAKAANLL